MTTIYNQDGLRAETNNGDIHIYNFDDHVITMTVKEYVSIALALTDKGILPTVDKEYDL